MIEDAEGIVARIRNAGAIFIGGPGFAALHSEPPIHQSRLFLSVVPCKQAQLAELKARVISVYPRDSRNEDP